MSERILIACCGLVVACSSSPKREADTSSPSKASAVLAANRATTAAMRRAPERDSSQYANGREGAVRPDTSLEARARFDLRAGDLSGEKQTRLRLEILKAELTAYYQKRGHVPQHLREILTLPTSDPVRRPNSRWLLDGWGHSFSYSRAALPDSCEVRSAGADGKLRTGDDIVVGGRARDRGP